MLKDIAVIVEGKVTDFAGTGTGGANWDATTDTMTLEYGGTSTPSGTITVKANGQPVSSTAEVTTEVSGDAAQYFDCKVGTDNIIRIARNSKPIPTTFTGSATVTVGLVAANGGEDLTPNGTKHFTVNLTPAAATTFVNRAPQQKVVVPKGLSFTRVSGASLSGSALKLTGSIGSSTMSSTIKATITPSGATGTITWTSSNPKVASVSSNGSQAKITGLSAGTATITAAVKGTDISKTIAVTVTPAAINITSFTAKNTANSTIEKETDGSYTWTRKSGTSCAAILKFSSSLSMSNATVTVTSSDKTAVSVGTVTKSGTTGQVQLTFGSMNKSGEVTITIKAGTLSESFKITLKGGDVVLK